jgi:L-threonylcarbamoyladenylate synthase
MALLLRGHEASQRAFAAEILLRGSPVGLPSETVYGLAALAFDARALAQIFRIKERPFFDPLIVHVHPDSDPLEVAEKISDSEKILMAKFWPGPLTLLVRKNLKNVPDLCTSGLPEVAMRSPSHEVFQDILLRVGQPLAAPSANLFGRISPVEAQHVIEDLGPKGLEAVVDAGPTKWGLESTIIRVDEENKKLTLLRPGALPVEKILECLGREWKISMNPVGTEVVRDSIVPGQLESHYAPFKRSLVVFESPQSLSQVRETARKWFYRESDSRLSDQDIVSHCLFFESGLAPMYSELPEGAERHFLSVGGNDIEAAAHLFQKLRELDEREDSFGTLIFGAIPPAGSSGLWPAIRDRLLKASVNKGQNL